MKNKGVLTTYKEVIGRLKKRQRENHSFNENLESEFKRNFWKCSLISIRDFVLIFIQSTASPPEPARRTTAVGTWNNWLG